MALDLQTTTKGETAIQNRYTFWYHRRSTKNNNEYIPKELGTFGSVESFWQIYDHMVRPNVFKVTTDYHLFKEGVQPMWEDEQNKQGGKWMVRLKKGIASRVWEELLLAIIGEQFDVGQEICGAVVSVRHNEDIISVWNRSTDNKEATSKIRDQIQRILKIPKFISIEYKKHMDAKADGSSFRNPSMVWKANSRAEGFKDAAPADGHGHEKQGGGKGRHRDRGGSGGGSSWKPSGDSSTLPPKEKNTWTNNKRSPRDRGEASGDANVWRRDTA